MLLQAVSGNSHTMLGEDQQGSSHKWGVHLCAPCNIIHGPSLCMYKAFKRLYLMFSSVRAELISSLHSACVTLQEAADACGRDASKALQPMQIDGPEAPVAPDVSRYDLPVPLLAALSGNAGLCLNMMSRALVMSQALCCAKACLLSYLQLREAICITHDEAICTTHADTALLPPLMGSIAHWQACIGFIRARSFSSSLSRACGQGC